MKDVKNFGLLKFSKYFLKLSKFYYFLGKIISFFLRTSELKPRIVIFLSAAVGDDML